MARFGTLWRARSSHGPGWVRDSAGGGGTAQEVAWGYVGTDGERRRATGVLAVLWAVAVGRWALIVGSLAALASLLGLMAYGFWIAKDTAGAMPEWWDRAVPLAAAAGLVVGALVSLVVIPFRRWRFETSRVVEEVAAVPLDEPEARTVERLMEGLVIAAGCEAPRGAGVVRHLRSTPSPSARRSTRRCWSSPTACSCSRTASSRRCSPTNWGSSPGARSG